jgi:inner membrane protein
MWPQLPAVVWLVLGFLFILVEILTPTFIFVFFGTSALVVGVALWLGLPPGGGIPFFLFSALVLGQLLFLRTAFRRWFAGKAVGAAGSRGEPDDFLGREVTIVSGFEHPPGRGRVSFRGTQWSATSPDSFSPGEIALICGRDGQTLTIEKRRASPAAEPLPDRSNGS